MSILIALIVFSILIVVHELGHLFAAKKLGVKVEKFSLGLGKRIFGVKFGDTEYVISAVPFGGYVKMAGDNLAECKGTPEEFYSQSPLRRFLIIIAGSLTNYIFAAVLFIAIFMIGLPSLTTGVKELVPGYPAGDSGIKRDDVVLEIDGNKVRYWDDLVGIVQKDTSGIPLNFKVKRGKKILDFKIAPKVIKTKNIFGQETTIGQIGIYPKEGIVFVKHAFPEAVALGTQKLITLTGQTYKALWLLITGGLRIKDTAVGPFGMVVLIGGAARAGFIHLLLLVAYINMALAVFNLLPIPVLDGGHILFLAIEKLRGRPLNQRVQEVIGNVALYLLMALFVYITWNDIIRFNLAKFLPFIGK